jgi:hypothetical protein
VFSERGGLRPEVRVVAQTALMPQQVPSTIVTVGGTPIEFLQGWWRLPAGIAAMSCAFAVVVSTSTAGALRPALVVAAALLFPLEGFLHEAAHTVVARSLGMQVYGIVVDITSGVSLNYEGSLAARVLVALAGPAASAALLGVIAILAYSHPILDLAPLLPPVCLVVIGIGNSLFKKWGDLDRALHSA